MAANDRIARLEAKIPGQAKITHKGWFGLCPIYMGTMDGDESAPLIVERHWVFVPLFLLSELIFSVMFAAISLFDLTYEPEWPIRVTGELKR